MALSRIIAHRIHREDPSSATVLTLRGTCWVQDGRIEECFRELKHGMIKRLGKDYGRFSDDHAQHPLSSWLKEYHEEKLGFESFSKKVMQHFKGELDKTEEMIDDFLIFAHEVLESSELVHIFVVQHNTAQCIDGNIDIGESFYLETSGVRLAAKINLTDWSSGDRYRSANAVTLLRWRGEKALSDAFTDCIGFTERIDVGAETEAFLTVVSDYTKSLPDDVAHHTKRQVVDYCLEQDKLGKPVVMTELSSQLKANPLSQQEQSNEKNTKPASPLPEFADFVSTNKPSANPELIPDKSQLRQFIRLSGRNHQLSMSFASSCLGDSIIYDPQADSLTIKEIPPRLKALLVKHLQNNH